MGLDVAEMLMIFRADARPALRGMAEIRGGLAETEASGSRLSGLKTLAMGAAAGLVTVAGVVAGIGGLSLKMAADFQTATTQLVTGAGESEAALEAVRQGILKMAPAVGQTPLELAKGLFMIESAGYHGADGLNVLRVAAEGAKVGGAWLETTANAVTTVMKDYRIAAKDAGDATNFLVSVVSQGKTHMEDLAGSLAHILPTASALGVPLNQIGGAMATLTARGVPAANAATYLRFTLSSLAAETPKGAKALESIGLTSLEVGDTLTHKGLLPAMELIQEHLTKKFPQGGAAMFAALKDITGGTRGLGAALGLTGQNLADFEVSAGKVTKQIKDGHGQVIGWSLAQKDFGVQFDKAKAAVEATAISIGTKLLPVATSVASWFADAVPKITPFINALADQVPAAIQAVVNAGQTLVDNLSGPFQDAVVAGQIVLGLVGDALGIVGGALDIVAHNMDTAVPLLLTIGGAWVAWNIALGVTKAIGVASMVIQFAEGLVFMASKAGIATTAQWLLNYAMDANPIGVVIIAVAALTAGLILAYTHIKPFKEAVDGLTGAVGGAFTAVFRYVGEQLLPKVRTGLEFMGAAAKTVATVAWPALRDAGGAMADAFGKIASSFGGIFSLFDQTPSKTAPAGAALDAVTKKTKDFKAQMADFMTSPGVVGTLAFFAVQLPAAIKVTAAWYTVLADGIKTSMDAIVTVIKVGWDISTGNVVQAAKDSAAGVEKGLADIKQAWTDTDAARKAINEVTNGSIERQTETFKNDIIAKFSAMGAEQVKQTALAGESVKTTHQGVMRELLGDADTTATGVIADYARMAAGMIFHMNNAAANVSNSARVLAHQMVGGSIVPDMVNAILGHYDRMRVESASIVDAMAGSVSGRMASITGPSLDISASSALGALRVRQPGLAGVSAASTSAAQVATSAAHAASSGQGGGRQFGDINFYGDVKPSEGRQLGRALAWEIKTGLPMRVPSR